MTEEAPYCLERCEGCPFKFGKLVGGKGNPASPLVIVGESPGQQEIKYGLPFVGPSGEVVDETLARAFKELGVDKVEPYVTNAFKCFPGQNKDVSNLPDAVKACSHNLHRELSQYPHRVILAMGNGAIWGVSGNYGMKSTQVRGRPFATPFAEVAAVPMVHPAFLLRGGGSLRQYREDVKYGIDLMHRGRAALRGPENTTWEVLRDEADIRELAEIFQRWDVNYIASDIETAGFSFRRDRVLCAGFTYNGKHVYVVPEHLIHAIHPLFNNFARFIWHNGKFDIKFLQHQHGVKIELHEDTMLMSYALEDRRGIHDLEQVAGDWLGSPNWKAELKPYLPNKNTSYDQVPREILHKYMAFDIANTFNLFGVLRPKVAAHAGSEKLYTQTLIPGSNYLARIERNGMYVDLERVNANEEEMSAAAKKHEEDINVIARQVIGTDVNVRSPMQLATLLYDGLGLKNKSKTRSTAVDVLDELDPHPAVISLKSYRKIHKGLSTYVIPAREHISDDNRVHTSYLIHGTATGRLASRDPNVQNIPRLPLIRGQYHAAPGRILLEVDLNQAELRSLACLSGDPDLCRIYTDPSSKGLHEEVRHDLYGDASDWSPSQIEAFKAKWYADSVGRILEEQKMRAKNVNFGIVYGITPFGLADQIEDSVREATRMLNAWAMKFPVAWKFIGICRAAPLKNKNLITVFGHQKRTGVVSEARLVDLQNEFANFLHQSTASTITLHGGMRTQDRLADRDALIINTVHDSILVELPDNRSLVMECADILIRELEQVPIDWGITRIPFKAEAKVGYRWGSLKDISKFYEGQIAA